MSWMQIFILDGGLCLTICLLMGLLAPVLQLGTETMLGQGHGDVGWVAGAWCARRRNGDPATSLATPTEVVWQTPASSWWGTCGHKVSARGETQGIWE